MLRPLRLFALAPFALWAAEEPTPVVPNDPFIDAVFECHGNYAQDYTSIANTASSIADRAAVTCRKEMEAYERHALTLALKQTSDAADVEAHQNHLVALLKESARTLTMESAVSFGAIRD